MGSNMQRNQMGPRAGWAGPGFPGQGGGGGMPPQGGMTRPGFGLQPLPPQPQMPPPIPQPQMPPPIPQPQMPPQMPPQGGAFPGQGGGIPEPIRQGGFPGMDGGPEGPPQDMAQRPIQQSPMPELPQMQNQIPPRGPGQMPDGILEMLASGNGRIPDHVIQRLQARFAPGVGGAPMPPPQMQQRF